VPVLGTPPPASIHGVSVARALAVSAEPVALPLREARRLALAAQGLLGPPPAAGRPPARVAAALRRLAAVQLDTISVLARSHELVAFSRVGAVGRAAIQRAYWGGGAFEYWAHAACVLPVEDWPWYAFRRRNRVDRYLTSADSEQRAAYTEVLSRLRDLGPLTSEKLGGARNHGGPWWDWSPLKTAVELLLASGRVVCTQRRGWRRVYDLPERALPAEVLGAEPPDAACHARLVRTALSRLGVGTLDDIADYFRLPIVDARAAILLAEAEGAMVPVEVEGWSRPAWADPAALERLNAGELRGRARSLILSPFDSLVWFRPRTERLFGFVHRIEAYTPAAQREHGYFPMPLLAGGRLAGRVDPKRAGTTLIVRRVTVEPTAVAHLAAALREAAGWVGCDAIALEEVRPAALREAVTDAIARLT
jgi:uncharacterized protein YcaQ